MMIFKQQLKTKFLQLQADKKQTQGTAVGLNVKFKKGKKQFHKKNQEGKGQKNTQKSST